MGRYTGRTSRLIIMCIISFLIFVLELVVGYIGNSLSLASDAFGVLSHLISMIIGLVGVRFSRVQWHRRNTYGFPRADVVGAFGNSVFATALMFTILIEAIKRFIGPQMTENALLVLIIGVVGVAINFLNYLIFLDCCLPKRHTADEECATGDSVSVQDESDEQGKQTDAEKAATLNIRGVLLLVMGDALGSVVVVVTGTIFYVRPLEGNECTWQCYIDPTLTVLVVIIILASAFPLMKESATILLQMVPKGVDVEEIGMKLSKVSGVGSIHEMHVWGLVSGRNIATLHVKCQDVTSYKVATPKMRQMLHSAGIHSVTIQPEFINQHDGSLSCSFPCISQKCDSKLCCSQKLATMAHVSSSVEMNGNTAQTLSKAEALSGTDEFEISVEPCWGKGREKTEGNSKDTEKTGEILNSKSTRF
uniref:Zinc transporter 10-like n=1 Tax=Geotrypetes seraphini TaxID=260995 RepID=A0A6P8R0R6_GEOSA|nr:zinc transporter 10-like [Geotrypetes seraphini]